MESFIEKKWLRISIFFVHCMFTVGLYVAGFWANAIISKANSVWLIFKSLTFNTHLDAALHVTPQFSYFTISAAKLDIPCGPLLFSYLAIRLGRETSADLCPYLDENIIGKQHCSVVQLGIWSSLSASNSPTIKSLIIMHANCKAFYRSQQRFVLLKST